MVKASLITGLFFVLFISACGGGATIVNNNPTKNTNKITSEEWLEKNKNSPVLRDGNGKVFALLLKNVLEPGTGSISPAPSGDNATLSGITRQMNKYYEKNFSETQITQIYNIAKDNKQNITYVIDNLLIDGQGDVKLK
jgi:hypothetical protein